MIENTKIEWQAPEYEDKHRSADWFWALGVVVVAGALASVIFGNYFFALLLVLGGILLGFYAIKKPEMIFYELNEKGLKMKKELFPYENIKSFWVRADLSGETNIKPVLFIKTTRIYMPEISMPIYNSQAEKIRSLLLAKNIPEEEMKEHPSERIMESLGF